MKNPAKIFLVIISLLIFLTSSIIGLGFILPQVKAIEKEEAGKIPFYCWPTAEKDKCETAGVFVAGEGCEKYGEEGDYGKCYSKKPVIDLQIPLPGLPPKEEGVSIADYIKAFYEFGVGAIAILATVMLMIGGFLWLTAAGSANQITSAKSFIWGAIIGLVLALTSYTLLNTINPALVRLAQLRLPIIYGLKDVCCKTSSGLYEKVYNECPSETEQVDISFCQGVDWEGMIFCKNLAKSGGLNICGYSRTDLNCVFVGNCGAPLDNICVADRTTEKGSIIECNNVKLKVKEGEDYKEQEFHGDEEYSCGSVMKEEKLGFDKFRIGTKCEDERQGCVIFNDSPEDWKQYQTAEDLRRFLHKIGEIQGECY